MNSAEQQTDALKGQGPRFDKELRQLREPAQVSAFPGLLCSSHPDPPQVPFSCLKKSHLPGADSPTPRSASRVQSPQASCLLHPDRRSRPRLGLRPQEPLPPFTEAQPRLWGRVALGSRLDRPLKARLPWQTEKHVGSFQKPNRLPLMGTQAKELSDRRRS